MAAFRLFSRLNTFYGLTAQLLPGGQLKFYDAGTTTPRDVYGDSELSVNNGNRVDLDSSGRPDVDVWGDGAYFVEVYDSLGVKQGEADDVQIPGAGGLTIPALETGKFLTNNGAVLLWSAIREVPDPTGQGGKVLGTDGTSLLWEAKQEPVATVSDGMYVIGGGGSLNAVIQVGTDTAPAAAAYTTSKAVTYPTPFKSGTVPKVFLCPMPGTQGGNAPAVHYLSAPATATGFTAVFDAAEGDTGNTNMVNPVAFEWFAIGVVDA